MNLKSQCILLNWTESQPINGISQATAEYQVAGAIMGKLYSQYTIHYLELNEKDSHQSTSTYLGYSYFESENEAHVQHGTFEDKGCFVKGELSGILSGNREYLGRYYLEENIMYLEFKRIS
ncbi:hypothetical protein ACWOFR_12760 [Carnobacterium gallinarum]|uniref:hypothetical protein n=1 Tax=Carnobacterium gallinarum TaxID=2749 RepID=UPI00054D6C71|nr:hypothetical protein [Carnobacterium gallinarum]